MAVQVKFITVRTLILTNLTTAQTDKIIKTTIDDEIGYLHIAELHTEADRRQSCLHIIWFWMQFHAASNSTVVDVNARVFFNQELEDEIRKRRNQTVT